MERSAQLDTAAPGGDEPELGAPDLDGSELSAPELGGSRLGAPELGASELGGELPTDEQLTELALAATAESPLPPDARPFLPSGAASALLPSWYMPAVATRRATPAQRAVVVSIVVALLVLEALGLCSVFGQVVIG